MMSASACRKTQREMEKFDRGFQIRDPTALNPKRQTIVTSLLSMTTVTLITNIISNNQWYCILFLHGVCVNHRKHTLLFHPGSVSITFSLSLAISVICWSIMLALPMMSWPLMLFELMLFTLLTRSKVLFNGIGAVGFYISVSGFNYLMHFILLALFFLLSDTLFRRFGRPYDGQDRAGLWLLRKKGYLPWQEEIASNKDIVWCIGYDAKDIGIRDAWSGIAPCYPDCGVRSNSVSVKGLPFADQTFGDVQSQPVDNILRDPILVWPGIKCCNRTIPFTVRSGVDVDIRVLRLGLETNVRF